MNTSNVLNTQSKQYFTLFLVSNMEEIDCYTGYNEMTKEILNGLLDKCVKYNLTQVYFYLCEKYPTIIEAIINDIENDLKHIVIPEKSIENLDRWYEQFCKEHNVR